ncbi:MAG TPA: mercuric transport protein MerTP [Agriterribacter sp.]|nr:mercuric transport protein MerTP [Agriterribacter sp.]
MKSENKLVGIGLFSAIAASLCCIAPVLALIAGVSGFASIFAWLEPARPYFIGLTILALGIAWNVKLRSKKGVNCNCEKADKPQFLQSKSFLGILTVFACLMLAFSSYSQIFYPKQQQLVTLQKSDIKTVEYSVSGMTCVDCERPIKHNLQKLSGVIHATVSYKNGNAIVQFDDSKTTTNDIEEAINATGYKINNKK